MKKSIFTTAVVVVATLNSLAQCAATYTDTINTLLHDGINCIDYPVVKIGTQWWMAENVNATLYADGTPVSYYNYNNDTAYGTVYGKLYQWQVAMNGAASSDAIPSGVQGVCPTGWHLPGDTEWKQLEINLGMSQTQADSAGWRGTNEGGQLKETGTIHWFNTNIGATNSTGFDALPGGLRNTNGSFAFAGNDGNWWSATEITANIGRLRHLNNMEARVYRDVKYKSYGFSVRCAKDIELSANLLVNDFIANNKILIAPNPFTSQTTISFNKEQKNSTIKIMDVLGKEIRSINVIGKELIMEKGEMQAGIYFLQLIDENKNVVNKKIAVQ